VYEETFEFDVHDRELARHSVQLVVKDAANYGFLQTSPVLGQIVFHLKDFHPSKVVEEWFELGPKGYHGAEVSGQQSIAAQANLNRRSLIGNSEPAINFMVTMTTPGAQSV